MIVFIVCVIAIVLIGLFMIYGIPRLWNYKVKTEFKSENPQDINERSKKKARFRPHALSIITVVGFIIGIIYIIMLIIGYPSLIFWSIVTFRFEWLEPMVIIHIILLAGFAVFLIIKTR